MKSFLQFVREATEATINNDKQELVRQKKHLLDKAKEYKDQAEREESHGQGGGAARAKGEGFLDNAKNIKESTPAWQRSAGKDPEGGLNRKGIASYRAANPGSKLSMAVTTKPSKLKPGSKAANRRKSFCARMSGVKGPMEKNGKPTRKALALRKWNC